MNNKLPPGKLHPGKAVRGKRRDQDRDHRGWDGHDQAVEEGVASMLSPGTVSIAAVGLPDVDRLAADHLSCSCRG